MKITSSIRKRKWIAITLLVSIVGTTLSMSACKTIPPLAGAQLELSEGRQLETFTKVNPQSNGVVVFENGARETINKWEAVLTEISKDSTVFSYNRPGYGRSDKRDSTRDGQTIVRELHQELQRHQLAPPYILVGHSMGGLYMQLFAKTYPNEVQGIVLVDALYPRVIKKTEDFPWLTRIAKNIFFNRTVNEEINHIHDTGEQVLALPSIDDKPMIRLINVPKSKDAIGVDFGTVNKDEQTFNLVKGMYPKAKQKIVDSDHSIQTANPEIVIDAIREIQAQIALGLTK